jgi:isopentenyl phosphate kinase
MICNALKKTGINLCLVHGGGSYGHYFAKKYKLNLKISKIKPEGVSKTRKSMQELNLIVLNSLERYCLNPFSFSPLNFINWSKKFQRRFLLQLIENQLVPVTYGDVLMGDGGFYILSGDLIARILSESLRPSRVVFLLDVDGIYKDPKNPNTLVKEFQVEKNSDIQFENHRIDVTGGIANKINESLLIANLGIDVMFVNGNKPDRVIKAISGEEFKGTIIKGINND